MRLAALLESELIIPSLEAGSKEEAIDELLQAVCVHHTELDRDGIRASIAEREALENTSTGRGFAFPHARTDLVKNMHIALGVSKSGLDDPTPDDQPLAVICLLLTPRSIAQLYLQTLSAFSRFARDPGKVEELKNAETAQQVIRVIWTGGPMVRKQLTVRDIMRTEPVTASPETTLKDIANLLYRHRESGLTIVDDAGRPLGTISEFHLIHAALPDFQSMIQHLPDAPPSDTEPFDELLKHEDEIKAADMMTTSLVTTTEDAPIVEVAAQMLYKKVRRVPVVRDDKLVGVVMRSDIVTKVIRG